MKKLLLFTFLVLTSTYFSFGQGSDAKKMLAEIEGKWSLDDNGNVTYQRVVEAPDLKRDAIYDRAYNYFVYNYGSGKSVIQTQNKDTGLIVAKGLYDNVHVGVSLITTVIDTWHIARVDVKDGKARIIVTLTEYDQKVSGGSTPPNYSTFSVSKAYPVNEKGPAKTVMTKAFYKSHLRAIQTMDRIEKAIKEGNTSKSIENTDF